MWLHSILSRHLPSWEICITKCRLWIFTIYPVNILWDKFWKCPSFIHSFCGEQIVDFFLIHPEHLWNFYRRRKLKNIQFLSEGLTEIIFKINSHYISIISSAFMGQCPQWLMLKKFLPIRSANWTKKMPMLWRLRLTCFSTIATQKYHSWQKNSTRQKGTSNSCFPTKESTKKHVHCPFRTCWFTSKALRWTKVCKFLLLLQNLGY